MFLKRTPVTGDVHYGSAHQKNLTPCWSSLPKTWALPCLTSRVNDLRNSSWSIPWKSGHTHQLIYSTGTHSPGLTEAHGKQNLPCPTVISPLINSYSVRTVFFCPVSSTCHQIVSALALNPNSPIPPPSVANANPSTQTICSPSQESHPPTLQASSKTPKPPPSPYSTPPSSPPPP